MNKITEFYSKKEGERKGESIFMEELLYYTHQASAFFSILVLIASPTTRHYYPIFLQMKKPKPREI